MTQFDESKETSGNKSASEAVNEAVSAVPVNDGTAANAVEAATAANETVAAQSSSAQPQPAQSSASQPAQPQEMSAQQLAFGNSPAGSFAQPQPVAAQPAPAQPVPGQPVPGQPVPGQPPFDYPPAGPAAGHPSNGAAPEAKPGFCRKYKWYFILFITLVYTARAALMLPSREKMIAFGQKNGSFQSVPADQLNQVADTTIWFLLGVLAVVIFVFALLVVFGCCRYEKKRQYEASLAGEDVYFSKAVLLTISLLGTCFLIASALKLTGGVLFASKAVIIGAVAALLFKIGEPAKPMHRYAILAVALCLTYTFEATPVNLFENV